MRTRWLILCLLLLSFTTSKGQICDPDSLILRQIRAVDTDPNISSEFYRHQVYLNTDCNTNDTLLLHLVGTFDWPHSSQYYFELAANNGYRVISLRYENSVPATSCAMNMDSSCHTRYRQEVWFGTPVSGQVNVDTTHSIYNRLDKLLRYLDTNFPGENWGQYIGVDDSVDFSNMIVSGHSQGAGHAAYIAQRRSLIRALYFAGPNDFSVTFAGPATWLDDPSLTPPSKQYGFLNLYDDLIAYFTQYLNQKALGLDFDGDSLRIDSVPKPFQWQRLLYTTDTSSTFGQEPWHSTMIRDDHVPLVAGVPVFLDVWKYMLGMCPDTLTAVQAGLGGDVEVFPNPARGRVRLRGETSLEEVALIGLQGQVLRVWRVAGPEATLDLAGLPAGWYWLRVRGPNISAVKPVAILD